MGVLTRREWSSKIHVIFPPKMSCLYPDKGDPAGWGEWTVLDEWQGQNSRVMVFRSETMASPPVGGAEFLPAAARRAGGCAPFSQWSRKPSVC